MKNQAQALIYEVTGTITTPVPFGDNWRSIQDIPVFYVKARSQEEAEAIAQNIVDPVKIAPAVLTAIRISRKAFRLAEPSETSETENEEEEDD
jgi:hypothetical protein